MSKDSSSSTVAHEQLKPNKPQVLHASITIVATAFLFLFMQFLGIILLYALLSFFGYSTDEIQNLFTDNSWVQFAGIFVVELLTVGGLYIYLSTNKKSFRSQVSLQGKPTLKQLGIAALTYGVYAGTFIAIIIFIAPLIPALNIDQTQQLGFETPQGIELFAVFGALVILPSIAEEIVFRGFLFKKLKVLISFWPATIMTSLVFGAAHLEFLSDGPLNWVAAIDTFIFSFFLVALVHKTKSLYPSIFLHAFKNGIAFVFLFLI